MCFAYKYLDDLDSRVVYYDLAGPFYLHGRSPYITIFTPLPLYICQPGTWIIWEGIFSTCTQ